MTETASLRDSPDETAFCGEGLAEVNDIAYLQSSGNIGGKRKIRPGCVDSFFTKERGGGGEGVAAQNKNFKRGRVGRMNPGLKLGCEENRGVKRSVLKGLMCRNVVKP